MVTEPPGAKLYITITNGKTYLYLNYYDMQDGKLKHIYAGSPYVLSKEIQKLQRVVEHWNQLDQNSKKTFLDILEQVEAQLRELKSKVMS